MRNNVFTVYKKVLSTLLAAVLLLNVASESSGASLFLPSADNKYDANKDFHICSINGTGDNLVVLLQDLHCHYDTQVKISGFLKNISKQDNFNKIFVEGASQNITGSFIKNLPQNIKMPLIESLLKDGSLTGAEHFFLTDESGVPLYALENNELYSQNAERLEYILNTQKEVSAITAALEKELKALQRHLSFQSRKMLSAWRKYENNKTAQHKYYKYLVKEAKNIDLSKYPQIAQLINTPENINGKKVKKELEAYLEEVKAKLPYGAYKDLLENDVIKNIARINHSYNIDISKYKALSKYLSFYAAQSLFNPLELIKEEKNLTAEILIQSANRKDIQTVILSIAFDKLKQFMANSATDAEIAYIKDFGISYINTLWVNAAGTSSFKKILPYFFEYRRYYLANEERDYQFADRIANGISGAGSVSAAVIGGFHTEEVKQMLLNKGLKVAVLTPKISGGIKEAEQKYVKHFNEQMSLKDARPFIIAFQLELLLQNESSTRIKALEIAERLFKEKTFSNAAWEDARKIAEEEYVKISEARIAQFFDKHFSRYGKVKSVKELPGGINERKPYLITAINDGREVKYVLKPTLKNKKTEKRDAEYLSSMVKGLKEQGIPIAAIYPADNAEIYVDDGDSFIFLTEFFEPPSANFVRGGEMKNSAEYFASIGKIMAAFQNSAELIEKENGALKERGAENAWDMFGGINNITGNAEANIKRLIKNLAEIKKYSKAETAKAESFVRDQYDLLNENLSKIEKNNLKKAHIHADMQNRNIFFDENKNVSGIIDFDQLAYNHRVAEFLLTIWGGEFHKGLYTRENLKTLLVNYANNVNAPLNADEIKMAIELLRAISLLFMTRDNKVEAGFFEEVRDNFAKDFSTQRQIDRFVMEILAASINEQKIKESEEKFFTDTKNEKYSEPLAIVMNLKEMKEAFAGIYEKLSEILGKYAHIIPPDNLHLSVSNNKGRQTNSTSDSPASQIEVQELMDKIPYEFFEALLSVQGKMKGRFDVTANGQVVYMLDTKSEIPQGFFNAVKKLPDGAGWFKPNMIRMNFARMHTKPPQHVLEELAGVLNAWNDEYILSWQDFKGKIRYGQLSAAEGRRAPEAHSMEIEIPQQGEAAQEAWQNAEEEDEYLNYLSEAMTPSSRLLRIISYIRLAFQTGLNLPQEVKDTAADKNFIRELVNNRIEIVDSEGIRAQNAAVLLSLLKLSNAGKALRYLHDKNLLIGIMPELKQVSNEKVNYMLRNMAAVDSAKSDKFAALLSAFDRKTAVDILNKTPKIFKTAFYTEEIFNNNDITEIMQKYDDITKPSYLDRLYSIQNSKEAARFLYNIWEQLDENQKTASDKYVLELYNKDADKQDIFLDSWKMPDIKEQSTQNMIRAARGKYAENGDVLEYPGVAVNTPVVKNNLYKQITGFFNKINAWQSSEQKKYIHTVPEESMHMTFYDPVSVGKLKEIASLDIFTNPAIKNEIASALNIDKSDIAGNKTPLTQNQRQTIYRIVEKHIISELAAMQEEGFFRDNKTPEFELDGLAAFPGMNAQKNNQKIVMILHTKPKSGRDLAVLLKMQERLKNKIGIEDYDIFNGHITVGYFINPIESKRKFKSLQKVIKNINSEIQKNSSKADYSLPVRINVSYFKDMNAFPAIEDGDEYAFTQKDLIDSVKNRIDENESVTIAFICSQNQFRSASADVLLRSHLKAVGKDRVNVISGGANVDAEFGISLSDNIKTALNAAGADPEMISNFKTQKFENDKQGKADIIIAADEKVKESLIARGIDENKIVLFSDLGYPVLPVNLPEKEFIKLVEETVVKGLQKDILKLNGIDTVNADIAAVIVSLRDLVEKSEMFDAVKLLLERWAENGGREAKAEKNTENIIILSMIYQIMMKSHGIIAGDNASSDNLNEISKQSNDDKKLPQLFKWLAENTALKNANIADRWMIGERNRGTLPYVFPDGITLKNDKRIERGTFGMNKPQSTERTDYITRLEHIQEMINSGNKMLYGRAADIFEKFHNTPYAAVKSNKNLTTNINSDTAKIMREMFNAETFNENLILPLMLALSFHDYSRILKDNLKVKEAHTDNHVYKGYDDRNQHRNTGALMSADLLERLGFDRFTISVVKLLINSHDSFWNLYVTNRYWVIEYEDGAVSNPLRLNTARDLSKLPLNEAARILENDNSEDTSIRKNQKAVSLGQRRLNNGVTEENLVLNVNNAAVEIMQLAKNNGIEINVETLKDNLIRMIGLTVTADVYASGDRYISNEYIAYINDFIKKAFPSNHPDVSSEKNVKPQGKKGINPVILQCIKTVFLLPLLPVLGTSFTGAFNKSAGHKEDLRLIKPGDTEDKEETSVYELMRKNGLGAIYDKKTGITGFGVYSKNAVKMELCLFDGESGKEVETRVEMTKDENDVWRYAGEIKPGQKYGFRAHGPYDPRNGHYFNPNKLAVDPYSFQQEHRFIFNEALRVCEKGNIYNMDTRDSAPYVPKSIVTDLTSLDTQTRKPPAFAPRRSRIYELHVGGFTALKEDLPQTERGTLKGLASPGVIAHLKKIGVNTVEVQPIQSDANDPYSHERNLRNNSGYQTVTFFALNPQLGDPAKPGEDLLALKETIGKLSEAGIRFGMDVVDNHSGEGSADMDPSLCYRLLDNSTYYLLNPDNKSGYDDASGCGNAFNTSNPVVLNMMTKYKEMYALLGTRLFRHDLMAAAARNEHTREFAPEGEYMQIFKKSKILSGINKREGILVTAEGYMATGGVRGVHTYFTENFHKDIFTWGSGLRDSIRNFIMGRIGPGAIAWAISSPNNENQYQPHMYYMGSHDGHPYAQLMAVLHKDNRDNGWGNNDGPNELGMGLGYGSARIPAYVASAMTVLSFLQGPIMFGMGDEFLRTQRGNNNPYNQSNEYLNMRWDGEAPLSGYMNALAKYRAQHLTLDASLGDRLSGKIVNDFGDKDITWVHPQGREVEANSHEWSVRHFGFMISGDRLSSYGVKEDDTLVMMNMSDREIEWKLPKSAGKGPWRVYSSTLHLDLSVQGEEVYHDKYLIKPGESVILYKSADIDTEREITASQAELLTEMFISDKTQLTDDILLVLMRYAVKEKESEFADEIMRELSSRASDDAKIQKAYLAAAALIGTMPPLAAGDFSVSAGFLDNSDVNARGASAILVAA